MKTKKTISEIYFEGEHSFEVLNNLVCDQVSREVDYQTITPSENTFKVSLVKRLSKEEILTEVGHSQCLVVKTSSYKRYLKKIGRMDLIANLKSSDRFLTIRPDFLCTRYGFVIEVDGPAHHLNSKTFGRDSRREFIYSALDLKVFRIDNDQIYNSQSRKRFIDDIVAYIKSEKIKPCSEKRYATRRKKIYEARIAYQTAKGQKADIGSFNKLNPRREEYPLTKASPTHVQWGGYRIQIRPHKKS